jgi:hypothetical protein
MKKLYIGDLIKFIGEDSYGYKKGTISHVLFYRPKEEAMGDIWVDAITKELNLEFDLNKAVFKKVK